MSLARCSNKCLIETLQMISDTPLSSPEYPSGLNTLKARIQTARLAPQPAELTVN